MNELQATHTLQDHDFGKLSRIESNPRARTRLYILHQYSIGKKAPEIAKNLSIHHQTARLTKKRYLEKGISSIYDAHRSGRNAKIDPQCIDELKKKIVTEQENRAGGRITGEDIQKILSEEYNAHYSLNGVYQLMKRIDMSWISARTQHPKADIQVQEAFKKTL